MVTLDIVDSVDFNGAMGMGWTRRDRSQQASRQLLVACLRNNTDMSLAELGDYAQGRMRRLLQEITVGELLTGRAAPRRDSNRRLPLQSCDEAPEPPQNPGYPEYNWETGEIDVAVLATDIVRTRSPDAPAFKEPPEWAKDVPRSFPNATSTDLAKISGAAMRAYVEHVAASHQT